MPFEQKRSPPKAEETLTTVTHRGQNDTIVFSGWPARALTMVISIVVLAITWKLSR